MKFLTYSFFCSVVIQNQSIKIFKFGPILTHYTSAHKNAPDVYYNVTKYTVTRDLCTGCLHKIGASLTTSVRYRRGPIVVRRRRTRTPLKAPENGNNPIK